VVLARNSQCRTYHNDNARPTWVQSSGCRLIPHIIPTSLLVMGCFHTT